MDTTHPLDLERFRKILARSRSTLHGGGADPERDTARRLAETMARAAGLSFEQAANMADGPSKTDKAFDFARMWADWQAAQRRKEAEAARHQFPESKGERMLREAAVGFDLAGRGAYLHTLPRKALRALKEAIPWPATISEAVNEVEGWDKLEAQRREKWGGYRLGDPATIRRGMVKSFALNGHAASVRDAMARARWIMDHGTYSTLDGMDREIGRDTVLADFERMGERLGAVMRENRTLKTKRDASEGHPVHRSSDAKRAAVEAVLRQPGADALSLRQIADAAGVSHETARKIRNAQSAVKN